MMQTDARASIRTAAISADSATKADMPAAGDADLKLGMTARFWHDTGLEITLRDYTRADLKPETRPPREQPGPCYTTRALAIVHLAMLDAYAIATGNVKPYGDYCNLPKETCAETRAVASAIAAAAATTLAELYNQQRYFVSAVFEQFEGQCGIHEGGKALGERVATQLLQARADDGAGTAANALTSFENPGVVREFVHAPDPVQRQYERDPIQQQYAKHWPCVRPFGFANKISDAIPELPSADTFDYVAAFDEVKEIGQDCSKTRTAEQLETGIFYAYDGEYEIGTPHRLFSGLIDAMAASKDVCRASELLPLYAASGVAMADGAIQAWAEKYKWDYWRPVVGIRNGSTDPCTKADCDWAPFGAPMSNTVKPQYSPNFPAYPSGHAVIGTAGLRVAQELLGLSKDDCFTFTSAEFDGKARPRGACEPRPVVTRNLTVDQAIDQNQLSRIYIGVHWRFDAEQGVAAGEQVAKQIVANFPQRASGTC